MSTHDRTVLASYVFGALPPAEIASVDDHLRTCGPCGDEVARLRDVVTSLDAAPPELLLDGPIDDGDVFFARLLRAAGGTQGRPRRRWPRFAGIAVAAVVAAAAVFGVGVVTGERTAPVATRTATPAAVRSASAHDPGSGVTMMIDLSSFNGWVDLQGRFTGVAPGSTCRILLVTRTGGRVAAGVWIAPPDARTSVVTVTGSAIVMPADVVGVEVDTAAGRRLVTGTF